MTPRQILKTRLLFHHLLLLLSLSWPWQPSKGQLRTIPLDCPSVSLSVSGMSTASPNDDQIQIPHCTILASNELRQPFQCARVGEDNVFRIIGEYGELTLNCTAPFQLDLDYDGFRPTEAIQLNFWKDVQIEEMDWTQKPEAGGGLFNISVTTYGILVRISSIQTLFDRHLNHVTKVKERIGRDPYLNQNLSTPIIYSRTGHFTIRGMDAKNWNKFQQFYFYFEEPLLAHKISFMENEHTMHATLLDSSVIKIPCRPSHFLTQNVSLFMTKLTHINGQIVNDPAVSHLDITSKASFDPKTGFQVVATAVGVEKENLDLFRFQCSITISEKHRGHTTAVVVWETDLTSDEEDRKERETQIFGLHLVPEKPNTDNLRVQNVVNSRVRGNDTEFSSLLRCFLDRVPGEGDSFFSFGAPTQSILEMRYSREFVLPAYTHLAYKVQKWQTQPKILDIFLEWANPHGVYFCGKRGSYLFQEYASGVNLNEFRYQAGQGWTVLPKRTTADDVQISLRVVNATEKMYTQISYTFVCQIAEFSIVKPILWYIRRVNGSQKMVYKDSSFEGTTSKWTTKLDSNEVSQIFCLNSLWDEDDWQVASMNLNLRDGSPPIITSKQFTYNFRPDSKNHQITCEAQGEPTPDVWWENLSEESKKSGHAELTLNVITKETVGNHVCRASNAYGFDEKIFRIEITETEFPLDLLLGIGIPLVTIFIILTIAVYTYFRIQIQRKMLTAQELREFMDGEGAAGENGDTKYLPLSQPYRAEEFEISPDDFVIDEEAILGSGAFGLVMKGMVRGVAVAVKTVKPGADKHFLKSLLSELKILMYLDSSPNLIGLVGANTLNLKKGTAYVFVELCEGGNLLSYVQNHRNQFSGATRNYANAEAMKSETELPFDLPVLHRWAHQIARGMAFLTSKKVIHGDLAARNVLLTGDRTAKITDFGLSRQLYSYSMYIKQSQEPLPWRWMAIESLCDLRFSCESDVWSYGVTLWELYTLGQVPFPCLNWDLEFVESIKNGFRMSCPAILPQNVFAAVLMPCWELEPGNRPTFNSIVETIECFLPPDSYLDIEPANPVAADVMHVKRVESEKKNENIYGNTQSSSTNSERKGPINLNNGKTDGAKPHQVDTEALKLPPKPKVLIHYANEMIFDQEEEEEELNTEFEELGKMAASPNYANQHHHHPSPSHGWSSSTENLKLPPKPQIVLHYANEMIQSDDQPDVQNGGGGGTSEKLNLPPKPKATVHYANEMIFDQRMNPPAKNADAGLASFEYNLAPKTINNDYTNEIIKSELGPKIDKVDYAEDGSKTKIEIISQTVPNNYVSHPPLKKMLDQLKAPNFDKIEPELEDLEVERQVVSNIYVDPNKPKNFERAQSPNYGNQPKPRAKGSLANPNNYVNERPKMMS